MNYNRCVGCIWGVISVKYFTKELCSGGKIKVEVLHKQKPLYYNTYLVFSVVSDPYKGIRQLQLLVLKATFFLVVQPGASID